MERRSAFGLLSGLLAVSLLLAGCLSGHGTEPPPGPTPTLMAVLPQDAEAMAKSLGITVEEATRVSVFRASSET